MVMERAALDCIANAGRLIVSVSVRSGKTDYFSRWLPAWFIGTRPEQRIIMGSHEAGFAHTNGRVARDILTEWGPGVFDVEVSQASSAAGRWDLHGQPGGLFAVGVGGAPIGRGADLILVDDPIKNFEAAMSQQQRDRVKDWFAGTLRSRLEPGGAIIVICSRWHEDDLSGWLLEEYPGEWTELRIPALCDDPDSDPLGRNAGDPLWPEKGWTRDELERTRREVTSRFGEVVWNAQYQQRPSTLGGTLFLSDKWSWCEPEQVPDGLRLVRAWDLAATRGDGDWTVGVLAGLAPDGRTFIVDVRRTQSGPDEVLTLIAATAEADGRQVPVHVPQDPGQAGKAQAAAITRHLAGHRVVTAPVSGDKQTRAWPLAAQQRAGNVTLVRAGWAAGFTAELEAFPNGRHDDQVDAAALAFEALTATRGGLRVR
jgi:predicted phage terminase large subunit-like protein